MSDEPALEKVAADAEAALEMMRDLRDQVEELEKSNQRLREMAVDHDAQLERLEDQTDLIRQIGKNSATGPDERAAIYVQTLVNKAHSNPNRDRAQLEVSDAVSAVQGTVARTRMYGEDGDFQHTVDLVDDEETLYMVEESRSSDDNTRLVLDLEDGECPASVKGVEITQEGAV